jgi:superoxide dismutase, Fe-Mn family
MELHHSKHHQTYVNSYNDAADKYAAAEAKDDIATKISLQPLINFHGGGHTNHSLFWENLAPKNQGGGEPPSGALSKAIDETFGGLEPFKKQFNTALAGIQGSGWAWLVKDNTTGQVGIKTYANQDPVVGQYKPLLGVDAWEHAVSSCWILNRYLSTLHLTDEPSAQYYLQYQNKKAEYFAAIWDVINWKAAEKRFGA